MKNLIISIAILITAGCSTAKIANKTYTSEEFQVGYGYTSIHYSSEEERTAVLAMLVKDF